MTPFLKQVADHYHQSGDIDRRCFVFPNRRSMVFFTKYLGEAVSRAGVPVVAPVMLTINDLFYKAAGLQASDRVRLLLELYDCYSHLNPKAESLDEFIFWGDVILSDFDDVDKYLVMLPSFSPMLPTTRHCRIPLNISHPHSVRLLKALSAISMISQAD